MTAHDHDNLIRPSRLIKKSLLCFLLLFLVVNAVHGQSGELTLYPAKVTEPARPYRLLPDADKQTDADAVPLYEKAMQSMPKGVNQTQIQEWLKLPVEQFPQEKAEEVVRKYLESLQFATKATQCKQCNWPAWKPGTDPPEMSGYRELAFVLRLWARLEISRGRYEDALAAMQTAFGMAKHLGQAPTIVQTLIGAAVGGLMCREIEQFVQQKDAPNLHAALAGTPEPLINVEKAIESERANLKDYNVLVRRQLEKQLKPAHDRSRLIVKRLDNHLNALQVVEAIRHYAATHDGQLPQTLSDIKDAAVPNDLVSGKAFEYRRTTKGATLKSAIPEGGNEKDAVHYEIVLDK
ncbi:MAG: hypothetical protein A2Z25_10240 [Planctomycetes bacterium RBG_16_55_9]|nr:MAG: hypothetical protein A2Z25_10240 [Planctomycetes bacterium RBG_16_55_9]